MIDSINVYGKSFQESLLSRGRRERERERERERRGRGCRDFRGVWCRPTFVYGVGVGTSERVTVKGKVYA